VALLAGDAGESGAKTARRIAREIIAEAQAFENDALGALAVSAAAQSAQTAQPESTALVAA
jgi:hypothetical protein